MGGEAVEAACAVTDRIRAWMSAPQIERKPLVTLRKMTLGRSARSDLVSFPGRGVKG